jgi:hypothetical protein
MRLITESDERKGGNDGGFGTENLVPKGVDGEIILVKQLNLGF